MSDAATIRRKRASLDRRLANVLVSMSLLKIECHHAKPTMKYCGDTGNYAPSDDRYWIDWHCPDCGSRWATDQSYEAIKRYPMAVKVACNV